MTSVYFSYDVIPCRGKVHHEYPPDLFLVPHRHKYMNKAHPVSHVNMPYAIGPLGWRGETFIRGDVSQDMGSTGGDIVIDEKDMKKLWEDFGTDARLLVSYLWS